MGVFRRAAGDSSERTVADLGCIRGLGVIQRCEGEPRLSPFSGKARHWQRPRASHEVASPDPVVVHYSRCNGHLIAKRAQRERKPLLPQRIQRLVHHTRPGRVGIEFNRGCRRNMFVPQVLKALDRVERLKERRSMLLEVEGRRRKRHENPVLGGRITEDGTKPCERCS